MSTGRLKLALFIAILLISTAVFMGYTTLKQAGTANTTAAVCVVDGEGYLDCK